MATVIHKVGVGGGVGTHLNSDICHVAQQMRRIYFCTLAFVPDWPPFQSWAVYLHAATRTIQRIPGVTSIIPCPAFRDLP